MYNIDLNSDLGESFGNYRLGMDEEVLQYVSSANIACGWHSGDPMVMDQTVKLTKENRVGLGAHPGFPDLIGFGRRNLAVSPLEAKNYVIYQVGALAAFAAVCSEVFADRAYQEDGSLVSRSQPGAVFHDKEVVISRAIRMIREHRVATITGKEISIVPDSLCVHGDSPMALEFVKSIRTAFEENGIAVKKMGSQTH